MTSLTIRDALESARHELNSETAYLESQLLLAQTLEKDRTWLIAHDDEPLSPQHQALYRDQISQRKAGHPIAYLLGEQEFWSLSLSVTEATLIPRPEIECLVEAILARHPAEACTLVDLGTGSGAIALALASELPEDRVIASDYSRAAIEVATANCNKHDFKNVQFFVGSWASCLAPNSVDIVVSNPPYIADNDEHLAQLQYEPRTALTAGPDGMDDIEAICADAQRYLKPHGIIALEHGFDQQTLAINTLKAHGFVNIEGIKDLDQNPRAVLANAP